MNSPYPPEVAAVRPGDELDWSALAHYLARQISGLSPLEAVHQFPNGSANLTYRLDFAGRHLIVRRPPFGHLAAGAHDMRRECRALSRLWRSYDRAPQAYLLCVNHNVIGADFLVIEYREGQVIWGSVPPAIRSHDDVARRIAFAVIEALAGLDRIDLSKPVSLTSAAQTGSSTDNWRAGAAAGTLPAWPTRSPGSTRSPQRSRQGSRRRHRPPFCTTISRSTTVSSIRQIRLA